MKIINKAHLKSLAEKCSTVLYCLGYVLSVAVALLVLTVFNQGPH